MTKGILSVGTPQVKVVPSQNTVIDLKRDPGYYANVKIIINYPSPYMTISEYTSGNLRNSYTINRPYQITYILTDDDQITLNDPNNLYDVIVIVQFVQATSEAVMLYRDVRFKALPITKGFGSMKFTSSQNWVVPSGVHKIKIIVIGGGGGGGGGSASYAGGGGGAGAISYAEAQVNPGDTLSIQVGAGGSAGVGGSSPTAGGGGGKTQVLDPNGNVIVAALGGAGGQPGGTSAAGAGGIGGESQGIGWSLTTNSVLFALSYAGMNGVSGNGTTPGGFAFTPALFPPGFSISSSTLQAAYAPPATGYGGGGGNPNGNGVAGGSGVVIIWWGD